MHKYAYIHTQTSIVVHKAFKCQRGSIEQQLLR